MNAINKGCSMALPEVYSASKRYCVCRSRSSIPASSARCWYFATKAFSTRGGVSLVSSVITRRKWLTRLAVSAGFSLACFTAPDACGAAFVVACAKALLPKDASAKLRHSASAGNLSSFRLYAP